MTDRDAPTWWAVQVMVVATTGAALMNHWWATAAAAAATLGCHTAVAAQWLADGAETRPHPSTLHQRLHTRYRDATAIGQRRMVDPARFVDSMAATWTADRRIICTGARVSDAVADAMAPDVTPE